MSGIQEAADLTSGSDPLSDSSGAVTDQDLADFEVVTDEVGDPLLLADFDVAQMPWEESQRHIGNLCPLFRESLCTRCSHARCDEKQRMQNSSWIHTSLCPYYGCTQMHART